jgi:hypothetical protein
LTLHPDTTSGRSNRQSQHAGGITTPTYENDEPGTPERDSQDQLTAS